jgi:hypothetical protein
LIIFNRMVRAFALAILVVSTPLLAQAQDCAAIVARAGEKAGLPTGLMTAIATVESGRATRQGTVAPWPWTLNQGGKSMYFATKAEALATLRRVLDSGITNIDVGCMQLNWRWHGGGFATIDQMIDPAMNAAYAARFLLELHTRLGTWELATAAYHSIDPDRARAYLQRVSKAGVSLATPAPLQLAGILLRATGPIMALPPPVTPAQTAQAQPRPDLPLVPMAAARLSLRETLPPRLQRHWSDLVEIRDLLAVASAPSAGVGGGKPEDVE